MNSKKKVRNIRWLGHAGCFIKEKPSTYIDPYDLAFPDIGDLILITDKSEHHCSPDTVKWLRKGATVIIAPDECVDLFHGGAVHAANPGEQFEVKSAMIEVLPAYVDETSFQSGKETGVGYIISYPSGLVIYHCGHTHYLPEVISNPVDVLLIPVGKHAEIDLARVAELINQINPKITIPLHWDDDDSSFTSNDLMQLNDSCQADVVELKPKK